MGIEKEREREEEKNNIFSKLKQTTLTTKENISDKHYLELKEDIYNLNQKIDLLSEQINKILTRTS